MADVGLDRLLGDAELPRDPLVGGARARSARAPRARGGVSCVGRRRRRCGGGVGGLPAIACSSRAATVGSMQRLAGMGAAHGAGQLRGLDVLEQVAGGAGADRRQQPARRRGSSSARSRGCGRPRRAAARIARRRPGAGITRSIRITSGRSRASRHAPLAVGGLADHLDPVLELEERPQPLAHDRVVVDDQDADRAHAAIGVDLQADRGPGRRALERIVQRGRRARGRAPASRSARGGGSAARVASGRSRRRRRRPRARDGRRAVPRRTVIRAGGGVAHGVVQRLLGDPQDLRVAGGSSPALRPSSTLELDLDRVDPPEHLDLLAQGAAPGRRARDRPGAARGSASAARPAPRARAARSARAVRGLRRGRSRSSSVAADSAARLRLNSFWLTTSCSSSASRLRSDRIDSSRLRSYRRALVMAIAACAASSSISSWSAVVERGGGLLLGQVEGADHPVAGDDRDAEERAHVRMRARPPAPEAADRRGCRRSDTASRVSSIAPSIPWVRGSGPIDGDQLVAHAGDEEAGESRRRRPGSRAPRSGRRPARARESTSRWRTSSTDSSAATASTASLTARSAGLRASGGGAGAAAAASVGPPVLGYHAVAALRAGGADRDHLDPSGAGLRLRG